MTPVKNRLCPLQRSLFALTIAFCIAGASAAAQTLAELPDAPQSNTGSQSTPQNQTQSQSSSSSSSSGSQQNGTAGQTKPLTKEEQQQQAQEELKKEEHQRIMGVVPNFNTTDNQHAAPLTSKQKFELDLRSSVDPFVFVAAGLDAGEEQAEDTFPEYGQGAKGYAKRFGASYADTFDGNLWGNAILPSLLHEDPRYFRMGTGTFKHRLLYALATNVWSKRDNGTWGPNYANVGGNFIGGGISNLYYPASDRGFGLTVTRALTVTAEGGIGSVFVEFWPDVSRHLSHRQNTAQQTAPDATKPVDQTNGTTTPKPDSQ